jgi:hypothetical protein
MEHRDFISSFDPRILYRVWLRVVLLVNCPYQLEIADLCKGLVSSYLVEQLDVSVQVAIDDC